MAAIAALFVETNGAYYGLPNVDPWDKDRDARRYSGPWPVVAHPPCQRRSNPEQCLLFVCGTPKRQSAAVRKLIIEPRREHSRKPDSCKLAIEQLVAGPYCELFSRESRPGWDCWGLQSDKFSEAAE